MRNKCENLTEEYAGKIIQQYEKSIFYCICMMYYSERRNAARKKYFAISTALKCA